MKKSRYTDNQILAILKQAEVGTPVPELCREHGMSSCSILQMPSQIRRYGCLAAGPTERT